MADWKLMFTFLLFVLVSVNTDRNIHYLIDILSIENRGGRCVDINTCNGGEGCCESSTCAITTCNYTLHVCRNIPLSRQLLYNQRYPIVNSCNKIKITESKTFERNGSFYNPDMPILFAYSSIPDSGLEVYVELLHNRTVPVLIDRFIIASNKTSSSVGSRTINGIFGFAIVEILTRIQCRARYCGSTCGAKNDTCICEPGYTGEDCFTEIDDCKGGLSCPNPNMECVDGFVTYECVCLPGFTGTECDDDIDECSDSQERCNSKGKCVNDIGSFHCKCIDGYTGKYCERILERFTLQIAIHAFINPGGRCIDVGGTCANGSGCCDDLNCIDISCDYMFLFCERPTGTDISYARSENRGDCDYKETGSFRTINGDTFQSSLYGMENPVIYKKLTSPIDTTEFYIELIDDDRNTSDANNELIDRFIVPITGNTTNQLVTGIFDMAFLLISITVNCSENFAGKNCTDFIKTLETIEVSTKIQHSTTDSSTLLGTIKGLSTVMIVMIALLITIAIFLFLSLLALLLMSLFIRKKKNKSTRTQEEIEMRQEDETQMYSSIAASNPLTISSVRERLESIPNTYQHTQRVQMPVSGQQPPLPQCRNYSSGRGISSKTKKYQDATGNKISYQMLSDIAAIGEPSEVYNFNPQGSCADDDYDYESPYWEPSNVERELISQLKSLKIPSVETKDLQELEVIGCGAFGKVVKGIWNHRVTNDGSVNEEVVAVKIIEGGASEEERVHFLKEAAIMGQFNHPNIVGILGIVANNKLEQYKIIMEFMPKGNLRGYLPSIDKSSPTISSQLLAFSRQIASAMNYLELKSFTHRDLAARNILISEKDTCKICDFGLSRDIQSESFYLAHGGKIPVKWSAPESINYRLWSTASDVWSYGCVLYEIWSLGYKPFHNCNNAEAIQKITKGFRLAPPSGCPRVIYELMIKCWNADSEARPSFAHILSILNEPEYKIIGWSEEDKATYTEASRSIGGPLQDGVALYVELQHTYKA